MPGPKTNEHRPGAPVGTRAVLRYARVSSYKVREVLDLVRGKPVEDARDILRFSERDAAILVGKLLDSAVANAVHNDELDPEELYVSACFADEGTTIKRWRPRARGRATRIRKRTCHVTVIVSRLPEEKLGRLRARQAAEVATRRARRVAGARKAEGGRGGRGRGRNAAPTATEVADAAEAEGVVDPQAEALAAVEAVEADELPAADAAQAAVDAEGPDARALELQEEEAIEAVVEPAAEAVVEPDAEPVVEPGAEPVVESGAPPAGKAGDESEKGK
jgi:large subunit ribosomal protein L22